MNVGDLQSMLSVEHSPMMGLGGTASGAPDSPSFAALLEQDQALRLLGGAQRRAHAQRVEVGN